MSAAHNHSHSDQEQLAYADPKGGDTQTVTLQRNYSRKLRGRFRAIRAEIVRGVRDRDIFDLGQPEQLAPTGDWDPTELTPDSYRSRSNARQHQTFMAWLRQQERNGVLTVISQDDNVYVRRAYDKGTAYAERKLRRQGVEVASGAIQATFNAPLRAETLDLLYSRNFDLLEGITQDTAKEISRELTRGLTEGVGPKQLGEQLTDRIDSVALPRATAMARHEILLSHNQASLDRYQQSGVVEQVEILTTDPCEECEAYANGAPYSLEEARGNLPRHPSCRCSYSPLIT